MRSASLSLLRDSASRLGIELGRDKLELFGAFGDLLIERNRHVNLTSVDDETGIVIKHFIDSLSLAAYAPELAEIYGRAADGGKTGRVKFASLLDVGAGAGFPGIPLKILFGGALDVTLIDSTLKKVNFMNDAARTLGLGGCAETGLQAGRDSDLGDTCGFKAVGLQAGRGSESGNSCGCAVVHIRAEDAAKRPDMRARFDFVTARALAALPKAIEYCMPFLCPGGTFIAMKGRRETAEAELAQSGAILKRFGAAAPRVAEFTLSGQQDDVYNRTLIMIKK